MKLPIAVHYNGKIYTDVELGKPSGGLLADTKEAFDDKTEFHGIHCLVAGGISIVTAADESQESNKSVISSIVRNMPYRTAEYVGIQIMAKLNGDDKIDAIYKCPRCRHQIIPEVEGDYDDRLKVSEIEIISQETAEETFFVELEDSIEIKSKDGEIVVGPINSLSLRYPVINDCISGSMRVPAGKDMRRQYAIYSSAIRKVNGEEADTILTKTWGVQIFERMSVVDLRKFGKEMQRYGLKGYIKKICPQCSKEWNAPVDTSGFFASGLESV